MARIHRWSVMIYGGLQVEFMETKYTSHIHRDRTSIFGKIVVNISKSIKNNNQIFRRLSNLIKFHIQGVCCITCIINSCMEEVYVGVIYNTQLDSNEGDLSPHASQTIHFSNTNENTISDGETPVELLSLEPQYGTELLLISSISIVRHSEASSWFLPP